MLWMTLTSAAPVAVISTAMLGRSAIRFVCLLRSHLLLRDVLTHRIQTRYELRFASDQAKVQANAPAQLFVDVSVDRLVIEAQRLVRALVLDAEQAVHVAAYLLALLKRAFERHAHDRALLVNAVINQYVRHQAPTEAALAHDVEVVRPARKATFV
jgi:hypothetical protein